MKAHVVHCCPAMSGLLHMAHVLWRSCTCCCVNLAQAPHVCLSRATTMMRIDAGRVVGVSGPHTPISDQYSLTINHALRFIITTYYQLTPQARSSMPLILVIYGGGSFGWYLTAYKLAFCPNLSKLVNFVLNGQILLRSANF